MFPSPPHSRAIIVLVAAMLVVVSVPAAAERSASDAERFDRQSALQALEQPAREGAERAIVALASQGTTIPAASREAAIVGAEEGARILAGTAETPPSPGIIREAAYGAVYGTLRVSSTRQLTTETVRSAVSGGLAGAALTTGIVASQGGNATLTQVRAGAQGGAEGAVATAARLPVDQFAFISGDYVSMAALGGAGGSVAAAGIIPIFGDGVAAPRVYVAAFGGSAGSLRGTAELLAGEDRVEPGQTLVSAAGSSGGVLSATVANPDITDRQLSNAGYAVALETVRRSGELTQQQMIEATVTGAVDRLVTDAPGDTVFPEALFLSSYNLAIGPPRDPDGDGLYEDINGNRVLSYSDVVTLSIIRRGYASESLDLSDQQVQGFDFNEDDVFDWRDIRTLDEEVTVATNETA